MSPDLSRPELLIPALIPIALRGVAYRPVGDDALLRRNLLVWGLGGVIVQDHTELSNKTGAGKPEGPAAGPIQLQGHNNPVFFRNIWVIGKTY